VFRRGVMLVLLVVLSGVWTVLAQETEYTGYLDASGESKEFPLYLQAGDSVLITTEATSGDLDTVLSLIDPNGITVAENDDRSRDVYDSAVGYTAPSSGQYTVEVRRFEDSNTSGYFTLNISIGDESVLTPLEEITRIQLSGETRTRDTEHFRIHYTLEGQDSTTESYVNALAISMEEIWRIEIDQMGWPPPPRDGVRGGNDLYDVYLSDLLGQGETAFGYTSPEDLVGDNPTTPDVQEHGATTYIVLENDFDQPFTDQSEVIALMRTTMAHEFNHAIQFGYEVDDMTWYYEATASWIETSVMTKDEDASGYVETVFQYPELCFGTESDAGSGLSVYGEWLFIQALVDAYGPDAAQRLWENVANYHGFNALEQMLEKYDDNIPSMLARYHAQNLVRDYTLAPAFHATVWLENTINDVGRWKYTGQGVQELGANYFALDLPAGEYYAGLTNDDGALKLWAVGVRGQEADAFDLQRGGNITTQNYDHVYLMVFNPEYDDSVGNCDYYDYSIDVSKSKGNLTPVARVLNATHFEALD
jgi:hypothetical protein